VRASLFIVLALAVASAAAPACSPDPEIQVVECTTGFIGDKTQDVVVEITARDADGHSHVLTDNSDVAILFPPQGGRVVFIGARAKNLDTCGVTLSGAIRDLGSGQVRLDNRTVNLVPQSDGFATSLDVDISTFSNVPVCPNQWSNSDIFDQGYQVELTVEDKTGKKGTKKLRIIPRCSEPGRIDECYCICKQGYVLGESCGPRDAGADSGSDSDAATDAAADVVDGG
jgi:hypothetical protein